jgi:hypothetical protein
MSKKKLNNKGNRAFIIMLIMTFAVSTATSYFYLKGKFSFDSSFMAELESRQASSAHKEEKKDTPRLYKHRVVSADGEGIMDDMIASTEDIVRKYLRTYNVSLLDLYMDGKGVVYIDLGDELKKNFKGDAFEELSIFAEMYKRVETVVPGLTALKILVEGHEAETIGGHIDISKPLGKEIADNI